MNMFFVCWTSRDHIYAEAMCNCEVLALAIQQVQEYIGGDSAIVEKRDLWPNGHD